ncbi:MAG: hypothetical protein GY711_09805 [bacterium]|nr:hypothetical protein [bacterium]
MELPDRLVLYLSLATLTPAVALADVLTVDAAGGADFLDIPQAVAAASDGDTLLVAAGDYSGFAIQGLDLSVLGSGTGVTRIDGTVAVDALAANQTVILDRLQLIPYSIAYPAPTRGTLEVAASQGVVHVQRCELRGFIESDCGFSTARPAALLTSGAVFFSACELIGTSLSNSCYDMSSSVGMRIGGAEVALDHCTITGGTGEVRAGFGSGSIPGSAGVRLQSGALFASSSALIGGDGGDGAPSPECGYPAFPGSDGGPGLQAQQTSTLIGCTLMGGDGGAGAYGCGTPDVPGGADGPATSGAPPTVLAGPARTSRWTSRWWEPSACGGLRVEVELEGVAGDEVFLALSDTATYMFAPPLSGVWLPLNPTIGPIPIAVLPASGQMTVTLDLRSTALGERAIDHFVQAYFVDAQGLPSLGTPASIVVLSTAESYCTSAPNSTGSAARIDAWGSPSIATNDLSVTATSLPAGRFGYLLSSGLQGATPLPAPSQGTLCLALPIVRGAIVDTGAGTATFDVDLQSLPVSAGQTWNFQLWFRDMNPGNTSNTTDGVAVVLCD